MGNVYKVKATQWWNQKNGEGYETCLEVTVAACEVEQAIAKVKKKHGRELNKWTDEEVTPHVHHVDRVGFLTIEEVVCVGQLDIV